MDGPTPEQIRTARESHKLTPDDAAALIHCGARAWRQWESGSRKMSPAHWELWKIKVAALSGAAVDSGRDEGDTNER